MALLPRAIANNLTKSGLTVKVARQIAYTSPTEVEICLADHHAMDGIVDMTKGIIGHVAIAERGPFTIVALGLYNRDYITNVGDYKLPPMRRGAYFTIKTNELTNRFITGGGAWDLPAIITDQLRPLIAPWSCSVVRSLPHVANLNFMAHVARLTEAGTGH